MKDPTPPPATVDDPGSPPGRPRRFRKWTLRVLALLVAIVAALLVTGFSIDLGSAVKARVEQEAFNYLERPMHVGRVSARLYPGDFVLENIEIEGREKGDRPFLTAKRLYAHVPWWTLFHRELVVEVAMTDWHMLVETFAGGRHNMPKLTPKKKPGGGGKSSFTITVNFVYADNGEFVYEDHVTPWTVVARNLSVDLARNFPMKRYVGVAKFHDGTVQIQNFKPMKADLTTRFTVDGAVVRLDNIDLVTDGAHSTVTGVADFGHWPEQTYRVDSRVDFARMRDIFFANETWRATGEGHFVGDFHLFSGGRDLRGRFTSNEAVVNGLHFPGVRGALAWTPTRFEVTDAHSGFYDGKADFDYAMDPLGTPKGSTSTFRFAYDGTDLDALSRAFDWPLNLRGRAVGSNAMTWPTGHFSQAVQGQGEFTVHAPDGVTLAPLVLPASVPMPPAPPPLKPGETKPAFDKNKPLGPLSVGGRVAYRFGPDVLELSDSWAATPTTHVTFQGRTGYRDKTSNRAELPFHVTSLDWQASDRLLVAIMNAVHSTASAVEVGGYGTFDGVMTESFDSPRIEGSFASQRMRAFDVTWGKATAKLVIKNRYADITDGLVGDSAESRIAVNGRFSLGYPRPDKAEEIRARVQARQWPLEDFRTAFQLRDWPIDGTVSADISLNGPYTRPFGSGDMTIERGVAWGESFDRATGTLDFKGTGLEINPLTMTKGTGTAHGDMWIGWDSTYHFSADGSQVAIESLQRFQVPRAPLTGNLSFTAKGEGVFGSPSYTFNGEVKDLYAGGEGVGAVKGEVSVRNNLLTIDYLDAASTRLQVSASGTIALNEFYDANLRLRFTDTSIDPYILLLAPGVSPFAKLVAGGSVTVAGELANPEALRVTATVDDAQLMLLDYELGNDGPVELSFVENAIHIDRLKLKGKDTSLDVKGEVPFSNDPVSVSATGEANLAILQGFGMLRYINSSGTATLAAELSGPRSALVYSGYLDITDGRIRHLSLPRSLEGISGRITFSAGGINVDQVRARMGNGDVRFAGGVSLKGLTPDEFNLTASGTAVQLRYPKGFESTVNTELQLVGPVSAPTLRGTVDVIHATYTLPIEADVSMFGLTGGGEALGPTQVDASTFPLTLDISVQAQPIMFVDRKDAKLEGHIERLTLTGTIDRPVLRGVIDLDSGEWFLAGNRHTITRGSIEFSNPTKIEPYFDIETQTRLRAAGQTYLIGMRFSGTLEHLILSFNSEPALPQYDMMALVFGESPDVGQAELRALRSPQEAQAQALRTMAAQQLFSAFWTRVGGSVVQKTIPFDTVQVTPQLGNEVALLQLTPGAKLTLGKRISPKTYFTYSRGLTNNIEVYVVDYAQSDRVSWVLTRNEDHTFSLDFRIRYIR